MTPKSTRALSRIHPIVAKGVASMPINFRFATVAAARSR